MFVFYVPSSRVTDSSFAWQLFIPVSSFCTANNDFLLGIIGEQIVELKKTETVIFRTAILESSNIG